MALLRTYPYASSFSVPSVGSNPNFRFPVSSTNFASIIAYNSANKGVIPKLARASALSSSRKNSPR
jgi:hypothetical protein